MNAAPNNHGSENALCPQCGQPGRAVSEITVRALMTERAKARLQSASGFRFCATAKCGIAYFQPSSGECVLEEDLRAAVFQKNADPKRLVCYCFGHTVEAIQLEVRAGGASRILEDIKRKCAQRLDDCERTNPQGSCCLSNVQRVIREAGTSTVPPAEGGRCCCGGD